MSAPRRLPYCPCGECPMDPATWTPECRAEAREADAPAWDAARPIYAPELFPGTHPGGRLFADYDGG